LSPGRVFDRGSFSPSEKAAMAVRTGAHELAPQSITVGQWFAMLSVIAMIAGAALALAI